MVLGTEHGDGGAGLGQPVGVDQADVGQLLEGPLDQGHRHAAPAVGQMAQGGQLLVALDQDLEDAPEHGRHHHGVGDRLGRRQVHPGLGRELGQIDQAPARPHRGQHGRDAGDVVRRDAHQGGVVGVGPHELDRLEHVAGEVAVAQHGGLGLPRRPAGEEQHGRVLGVAVARGAAGRRPPRTRPGEISDRPAMSPPRRGGTEASTTASPGAARSRMARSWASARR